jgi:undecaprenyl-diphosphatase
VNDTVWEHPLMDGVHRFDAAVERVALRLRRRTWVDRLMYGLSEAGNHSLLWHTINAVDAMTTHDPAHRRAALRRSVVQGTEQALVNGPIKMVFRRQRPGHVDDHPHDLRVPVTSSFPSGHATAGFCAATLLAADLGRAPLWYSLAAVIGWSRVHVGVHHPSDVAAGALIGLTTATVAGRLWESPVRR